MRIAVFACALGAAGSLSAQDGAPRDRITLRNENVFVGTILGEDELRLRIRIGPGRVVEIERKDVAAWARLAPREARAAELRAAPFAAREAWFRIVDADGTVVGKLHVLHRPETDGRFRLEEQWTLERAGRRTLVTRIEHCDRARRPLSAFYHESVVGAGWATPSHRPLSETLRRADVEGERLVLSEVGPSGRQRETLAFPRGNSFPLLALESLRQRRGGDARTVRASIFDPMDGVFELRVFEVRERLPLPLRFFGAGAVRRGEARRITWTEEGRRRGEWLDAEGRLLLVEVNGVQLVGEAIPAASGAALARFGVERARARHLRLRGCELWLPSASWAVGAVLREGWHYELQPGLPRWTASLHYVPARPEARLLERGAQDFLVRYRLEAPWLAAPASEPAELAGRDWLRIAAGGADAEGQPLAARVWVCEVEGGYLALAGRGPARHAEAFDAGLRAMARGLEVARRPRASAPGR